MKSSTSELQALLTLFIRDSSTLFSQKVRRRRTLTDPVLPQEETRILGESLSQTEKLFLRVTEAK